MSQDKTAAGVGPRGTEAPKRRRRQLLLWSALPVLLGLGAAAKLLSLGLFAGQAEAAFGAGDAAAARTAAAWLQPANILEPHKAPFAAGDAEVLAGNYEAARQKFTEALNLAPAGAAGAADACVIRVNLVLTIEHLGDGRLEAGDPSSAAALYAEAQAAADAVPEGCFAADSRPTEAKQAEAGERLTEARERLAGKAAAAQGDAGRPDVDSGAGEEDTQTAPQQGQLEQLEESARQSQRERNSGREREEYLNDGDHAAGPDRPW